MSDEVRWVREKTWDCNGVTLYELEFVVVVPDTVILVGQPND